MEPKFETHDQSQNLIEGIRSGRYSLLLGAGFSMAATSANGKPLPSAQELVNELTAEFGMPTGHSLPRLWGALPSPQRELFLEKRFKDCIVPSGSLAINRFVWRGIWNLNVDDVVQKIYSSPGSLQKLRLITPKRRFSTPESLDEVNCVHLHGTVLDPQSGYVFSTHDYGALTAKTPLWGSILADELAAKPFLVIGSSLDEYDIEHYLELRSGLDSSREPLPSFIVTPHEDPIIRATAQRYGLIPVQSKAVNFLQWLRGVSGNVPSPLELVVPKSSGNLYSKEPPSRHLRIFHRQFLLVREDELPSPLNPRNFLHGLEPTWHDFINRHDVLREDLIELLNQIKNARESRDKPRIILVTSPPGSGKTTLIMRAALELSKLQLPAYFFSGSERLAHESAAACLCESRTAPVIFVDAFADHTDQIIELFKSLDSASVPCVIVGAERDNDLRRIRMSLGQLKPAKLELSALSRPEAVELVGSMRSEGLLGRNAARTDNELADRIARKQLIVAMCEIAGDDRRFDQIVSSQWNGIRDVHLQRLLAVVAIAHSCGYSLKFAIGERCAGIDAGWIMREIGAGSLSGIIFRTGYGAEYLLTAHRVIAEKLLSTAMPEEERFNSYISLARALARYVSRDTIKARTIEARLGARLLDYDAYVRPKLGARSRDFYEKIRDGWSWNSRYWEQIALLELRDQNYEIAIVHAEHAVGIEEHPFTFTTLGHVLVTAASGVTDFSRARDYFVRGADALREAIRRSVRWHFLPIHPYHSAIVSSVRFVKRWRISLGKEYEEWIDSLFATARSEYPHAFDWETIRREWTKALAGARDRG